MQYLLTFMSVRELSEVILEKRECTSVFLIVLALKVDIDIGLDCLRNFLLFLIVSNSISCPRQISKEKERRQQQSLLVSTSSAPHNQVIRLPMPIQESLERLLLLLPQKLSPCMQG